MIATALAAALGLFSAIRPSSSSAEASRFVILHLRVNAYGIPGEGTIAVDRTTGAFVRRFDVGPAAEQEGFNGREAWRADATGFPRIQGNRDQIGVIRLWSHLLTGRGPDPNVLREDHSDAAGHARKLGLRWPDISRSADVVVSSQNRLPIEVLRRYGGEQAVTHFAEFQPSHGLEIPRLIRDESDSGSWSARVTSVDFPGSLSPVTFDPPAKPKDVVVTRTETFSYSASLGQPILSVRLNDGQPLQMILDTGGQNVITPAAAHRLKLALVGHGLVGGFGSNLVTSRFAAVRSERIGSTVIRNQSFAVFDLGQAPIDGIVGYELLARLNVRVDFAKRTITLSPNASPQRVTANSVSIPFAFNDRLPQVEGSFNGIPGPMGIDTGGGYALLMNTPVVQTHHLVERSRATVCGPIVSGVGGHDTACFAPGSMVTLGELKVPSVLAQLLTAAHTGADADPSTIGNVGDELLNGFTLGLDYARQELTLRRNGSAIHAPTADHSGIFLDAKGTDLLATMVLTGTPGYSAGLRPGQTIIAVNGSRVTSRDQARIEKLLSASVGKKITLRTKDGRSFTFRLRRYV